MADDIPTPESPKRASSSAKRRGSRRMDFDSDSSSDVIEETPEQRFSRLIDEHDRDFKKKFKNLIRFADMLKDDHSKSIKSLKSAHKAYVNSQEQPPPPQPPPNPPSHEDPPRKTTEAVYENNDVDPPNKYAASQPPSTARPTPVPRGRTRTSQSVQNSDEQPAQANRDQHQYQHDQDPTAKTEASSVPPRRDMKTRLVDYEDDDESLEYESYEDDGGDIEHEESFEEIDDHTASAPPLIDPPPATNDGTPKKPAGTGKSQNTPRSARAPQVRWSEEEEELMIQIIHDLMQEDDTLSRGKMWRRAEVLHRAGGYDRTHDKMMAKWSAQTRAKCEERGMLWAADVMQKNPHAPRKRHEDWSPDGRPAKRPFNSKPKKWKRGPKKRRDADSTASVHAPVQPLGDASELHLQNTFEGASAAIVDVDWSVDGNHFVAASNSVVDDANNFKDNKPKNLLYGSLPSKILRELPEHRIENENGNPRYIYQTVSAVKFAKTGHRMYSGGFDHKLRVWDVEDERQLDCKAELQFRNKRIEVMDVPENLAACLATGAGTGVRSIRVFMGDPDLSTHKHEVCPLRGPGVTSFPYAPTCLKFGRASSHNRLIAGFAQDDDSIDQNFGKGCFIVWQFTDAGCSDMSFDRGDTFVSDCKWSQLGDLFVVGCMMDEAEKGTRSHSMVKLFSTSQPKPVTTFSCPARDINDVTYAYDLVTASCTNGATYVWDRRSPSRPLHTLMHGDPVEYFRTATERELNDVGVRYLEWEADCPQLYTGGSDGFLKLWDTRRSSVDVLVQDVVNVGHEVLCGKFSPDHSSLLIGDEIGRLHLLSKKKPTSPKQDFEFRLAEKYAEPES